MSERQRTPERREPREELLVVYHDGAALPLLRSSQHSPSVFGGPLELELAGAALPRPLHHIATLQHVHLSEFGLPYRFSELPLAYGLSYSGCTLRYRFKHGVLTVEAIEPGEPGEDWPYADYPPLLPYVPLECGRPQPQSWEHFASRAANLPATQPAELVVLVSPPATLGFSMWGRAGDAEGVTLVFECALDAQWVVASNVCG